MEVGKSFTALQEAHTFLVTSIILFRWVRAAINCGESFKPKCFAEATLSQKEKDMLREQVEVSCFHQPHHITHLLSLGQILLVTVLRLSTTVQSPGWEY